ncbi:MAG: CRISPR-associated endonuclease Cas2 [Candidatus Doudnabacteria bacterium]|nr:CRISPR-associated endonuclease Cas2 [Candidatus Doudnabacteria bacterium]
MNVKSRELISKIARELFDLAKDLALFAEEFAFTPYGQLRYHKIPRTTYYRKLEKFEKHGLVKKIRRKYGNDYVLTEQAKRLRKNPSRKIARTDGLSTVVIFDIHEDKHKARDNFRRYLIKNGYTQIQKSVFISPFKIFTELKEFAEELGTTQNITFLSGRIDRQ